MADNLPALPDWLPDDVVRSMRDWPEEVQAAFCAYLDLPATGRSFGALVDRGLVSVSLRTVERWAARYGWRDASRGILAARTAGEQYEVFESVNALSRAAAGKLAELLNAQRAVMSPTGDVVMVPDGKLQLAAAESLLDRAGLGAVKRSDITIAGADGGPVRVDHRHLHAELDSLSPAELLARLQAQALGGS